ncbi:MAG: Flp pilus assembly complex ATPase component TadA [Rubrivivax sp.]|nr:Flp pilus assembly complex ATPase component TadA [Rubrivivax sp.]
MSADPTLASTGLAPDQALGELLVEQGKLGARDLERALAARDELGQRLPEILLQLGLVSETDMALARSRLHGVPYVAPADLPETWPEVEGLRPAFLATHRVLPLARDGSTLSVALADPGDAFVLKALRLASGLDIQVSVAASTDIDKALSERSAAAAVGEEGDESEVDASEFRENLKDLASEAPVIRLVNTLISRVVDLRASDIHLEPYDDGLHVRYRVDGALDNAEVLAPRQGAAVTSRIKLLAHLDIAERRLPQDGRIRTRVKGRELDLRVSTLPSVYGESVVMRVLDRNSALLNLDDMGMQPETLAQFRAMLARPHGILLVTGPTGAGKTTTLYAGLASLDALTNKIVTVEDPVEYQLPRIVQLQVQTQIGLTFAGALRSILRQDPDIIMIGEMRDGETAQIAVQAALTGHLVLSTLHTNNAASAVIRMRDMEVEPFLITSTVNGVIAQRLVRNLCPRCKEPYQPEASWLQSTGMHRHLAPGAPLYRAVGCPECRGTGYRGRSGLYELLVVDDTLRRAIMEGADATALQALAMRAGMLPLHEDGLRAVARGVTTHEEVLRVTHDVSDA